MTIQDLINSLAEYNYLILIIFITIPFLTYFTNIFQKDRDCQTSKIKYIYSVLIYLTCIPGMAASVLTAYSIFFIKTNFLKVNFLIYLLPIISMVVTLLIIRNKNSFEHIPGFNKIEGLMILLTVSFIVSLALYKTLIIIGFIGGFLNLIIVAVAAFIFLKIGWKLLAKK